MNIMKQKVKRVPSEEKKDGKKKIQSNSSNIKTHLLFDGFFSSQQKIFGIAL